MFLGRADPNSERIISSLQLFYQRAFHVGEDIGLITSSPNRLGPIQRKWQWQTTATQRTGLHRFSSIPTVEVVAALPQG
jgi:hypothetical protein